MRLESVNESRVVFDPADVSAGWVPHLLDPHWVLLKDVDHKSPREACRVRLDSEVFRTLSPQGEIKSPGHPGPVSPCVPTCPPGGDSVPETAEMSLEDSVMLGLMFAEGPLSGRALAELIGKPHVSVARAVEGLIRDGKLVRGPEGLRMNSAPGGC